METLWFILVSFMFIMYIVLDGYDFGAGMVYWFFAKDEHERQLVKISIGPFWDGNEVFLIAGGGTLFFAFPLAYSSSFSGFYFPLIILLWLLILRGISLELRNHVEHVIWKRFLDFWFGITGVLIALFLGAALGNIVRGVNLGGIVNGTAEYDPQYFFTPLWNTFAPFGNVGVLDWFTSTMGVIAVVTLFFHGAAWIIKKTDSPLNDRLRRFGAKWSWLIPVLVIISAWMMFFVRRDFYANYFNHPFWYIFPAIGILAGSLLPGAFRKGPDERPFFYSSIFIFFTLASTVIGMYPLVLPSTNDVNPSLTIYDTAAGHYGLVAGIIWWSIALILTIFYFGYIHKIFRGKMSEESLHY